jgi:hypothetical protein
MLNPFFHRCLNVSLSSVMRRMNTLSNMGFLSLDQLEIFLTQFYAQLESKEHDASWGTYVRADLPVTLWSGSLGIVTTSKMVYVSCNPTFNNSLLTSVSYSDLLPYAQRMVVQLERNFPTGGAVYLRLPVLEFPQQNVLVRMTLQVSSEQSGVAVTALRSSLC